MMFVQLRWNKTNLILRIKLGNLHSIYRLYISFAVQTVLDNAFKEQVYIKVWEN